MKYVKKSGHGEEWDKIHIVRIKKYVK
jgi:hypothetical protein